MQFWKVKKVFPGKSRVLKNMVRKNLENSSDVWLIEVGEVSPGQKISLWGQHRVEEADTESTFNPKHILQEWRSWYRKHLIQNIFYKSVWSICGRWSFGKECKIWKGYKDWQTLRRIGFINENFANFIRMLNPWWWNLRTESNGTNLDLALDSVFLA